MMTFGSLFAGIGGFDLGLERAGMHCEWQVEKNGFCNKVLEKHWPNVQRYRDVREVGQTTLTPVDLICGGFPCQPFSQAGKQTGAADDRDLWPEMFRIINELRPTWVICENVTGFVKMALDRTLINLEDIGYTSQTFVIPACAVAAPHQRQRVWIICYSNKNSQPTMPVDAEASVMPEPLADADKKRKQRLSKRKKATIACSRVSCCNENRKKHCQWPIEPNVGRVVDGVSVKMDRLRSLGNAVVPQIVEEIGKIIITINTEIKKDKN